MNKSKGFLMILALLAGIVMWNSCENEEDGPDNEANHNVGNDCLMCHKAGGGGEGIFTAAGSVFKAGTTIGATGAVIRLYTTADFSGTPVASMTSAVGGNFYTKSPINFGTGLYVRITSSTGASSMISPIVNGSCNSCHGSVTGKISVQ